MVEVMSWRFAGVCWFAQVPKGRGAKTGELRGSACAGQDRRWGARLLQRHGPMDYCIFYYFWQFLIMAVGLQFICFGRRARWN